MTRLLTATRCYAIAFALLAPAAFAQTLAITGGTVYTGDGTVIENGTVLIENGRIAALGADATVPAGVRRIDATGKWVTPGLVNAATSLGLVEIGYASNEASLDENDVSAAFQVFEALNPASQLIPVTRAEGITTAVTMPSGGLIAGQAAAIDLAGETVESMLVATSVGVVADLSEGARSAGGGSRAGVIARLRRVLRDAREYDARRQDFLTGQMQPLAASQDDLDALVPVLKRETPLIVTANRRSDLEAALRLADEFGIRLVLLRGREAWQIADRLASAGVGVVLDPLDNIPSYDAPSARLDNAARLIEAGVPVAFATFDAHNARNIRQLAGNAVASGVPWDAALQAVTSAPATLFGLAAGRLVEGQRANVVVWSGDPFELSSAAEHVFIRGREVPAMTRQRALMERYRTRSE